MPGLTNFIDHAFNVASMNQGTFLVLRELDRLNVPWTDAVAMGVTALSQGVKPSEPCIGPDFPRGPTGVTREGGMRRARLEACENPEVRKLLTLHVKNSGDVRTLLKCALTVARSQRVFTLARKCSDCSGSGTQIVSTGYGGEYGSLEPQSCDTCEGKGWVPLG